MCKGIVTSTPLSILSRLASTVTLSSLSRVICLLEVVIKLAPSPPLPPSVHCSSRNSRKKWRSVTTNHESESPLSPGFDTLPHSFGESCWMAKLPDQMSATSCFNATHPAQEQQSYGNNRTETGYIIHAMKIFGSKFCIFEDCSFISPLSSERE